MAKRDSYEDDDDFLDEEIADWDDDEELDDDNDADESDDSSETEGADDDSADDDFDEPEDEVAVEKKPSKRSPRTPRSEPVAEAPVEEAPPPPPIEEEIDYPPDDEKALAALRKLRVRLDVNDKGNVWRAIFDDTNGKDPSLVLLKGLPALKELWLLGTKVTPSAAESFKTDHPKVRVFS